MKDKITIPKNVIIYVLILMVIGLTIKIIYLPEYKIKTQVECFIPEPLKPEEEYPLNCCHTIKDFKDGIMGRYDIEKQCYSVYLKGREFSSVSRTDYHEFAHYFVEGDKEHFCKDYKSLK